MQHGQAVSCSALLDGGPILGIEGPVDVEANDQTALGQLARDDGRELEALVDVLEEDTAEDVGIELANELGPNREIGRETRKYRTNVLLQISFRGNGAGPEPGAGRGDPRGRFADDLLALPMSLSGWGTERRGELVRDEIVSEEPKRRS